MNEQIERNKPKVEPKPKTVLPDKKQMKPGTKVLKD